MRTNLHFRRTVFTLLALLGITAGSQAQDMTSTPLTFEAIEAGTVSIENPNGLTIEYSTDGGINWTSSSANPISIAVAANDVVQFRGNNAKYGDGSPDNATHFTATNDVYVYGNIMSLVDKTDFATNISLTSASAFEYLFAKPYTGDSFGLFDNNTTIKSHGSKELVLPATSVPEEGYTYMFAGCQGLTRAPQLPATTLGVSCYHQMFANCTGLTRAPELLATTLVEVCYSNMFDGCSNLNYVKCLATDLSASDCTWGWLDGVAATGTFVKAEIVDLPRNANGIPAGWTVETEEGVGHSETLTANSDGEGSYWTTYYNGLASVSADADATVYTAKVSADKTQVTLTEVTGNVIPAGNAVVMKSTAASVTLTVTDASGTLSDNDLLGQSAPFNTPGNLFALIKGNSGVGFYRYPTTQEWYGSTIPTTFPAQKAYLITTSGDSSCAFIGMGENILTAIGTVKAVTNNGTNYDLTGRRTSTKPQRGIYVRNGKKITRK